METTNKNTALLVMDVQGGTVARLNDKTRYINTLTKAIQKGRDNNIPIIYVVIGFRKGYPEVSPNNRSFSFLMNGTMKFDTKETAMVYEAVAPQVGDIIVTKKRVSAFTGSDLEVILRSMGIKHLVLTGIATGGVVLSTLREAADKDYALTVLSDACADMDEEVHRVLTTKIFPRQSEVIEAQAWKP
jgi:nicotinamidase-related amidase